MSRRPLVSTVAGLGAALLCLLTGCPTASSTGPEVQACVPTTCAAQGKVCGKHDDGCGATLDCNACAAPLTCGGAGDPEACGSRPQQVCSKDGWCWEYPLPQGHRLTSLWGAASSDVWAVG